MRVASLFLLAVGAFAQGTISGVVSVPGGAPFVGAAVTAKNTATGSEAKATSSAKGEYTLADLPAGTYDLSVAVPGVKGYQNKGVALKAGQALHLDVHLEEGTQLSTLGEDPVSITHDMNRKPPSGPTPRTFDGKPDLTGVWRRPRVIDPGKPEWLPSTDAITKQRMAGNGKDSPFARCLVPSPVRFPAWFKFIQAPTALVMILDDDVPGFRQVFMDGRGHPEDVNPTWTGDAIGKWDGDTLVVDRVGFNDKTWLDNDGRPHTEKLHIVDRYRRPDLGHLEMETMVEDPGVLKEPWVMKRVADLAPGKEEVLEFICTENNRDVPHLIGK